MGLALPAERERKHGRLRSCDPQHHHRHCFGRGERRYRHRQGPGDRARRAARQGPARDRRHRPDRGAGRHRRARPLRPGHGRRLGLLRRFRERQPRGGGRRHNDDHSLRLSEQGPVAARCGEQVPPARQRQVFDRLRLPRDPVGSGREDHGPGFSRARGRWLHILQDLHDLRRREAQRPPDTGRAGGGAARTGHADDPCREFGLHRMD